MSRNHGSGRGARGAPSRASARNRMRLVTADTAQAERPDLPSATGERPHGAGEISPVAVQQAGADQSKDTAPPPAAHSAAAPSADGSRDTHEQVLDTLDPEVRALREDLGEALGLYRPPANPQTTDTAVLPAITDATAVLTVSSDETAILAAEVPAPPAPSGAPVGPAIPGDFRVEPTAGAPFAAPTPATEPTVPAAPSWFAPDTTSPLPRIRAPWAPPPAPVPITPRLLHRIFGLAWPDVVDLVGAETAQFGQGRIATIHHSPTDEGVTTAAMLYGFGRTPLVWDGEQYTGGEPHEDRMHPSALMHALCAYVRDGREPNPESVGVEA